MKILLALVAVVLLAGVGLLALSLVSSRGPEGLGATGGRLADCPDRDNCVSSQASTPGKRVAPIPADGPVDTVMDRLAGAVEGMGGAIIEREGPYLRAVFTSPLWRFRDDLECLYRPEEGRIEVRSGSRVGYADFGVNRRRADDLRAAMARP